jgi:DNA-binding transcriptional ArsR family regulator
MLVIRFGRADLANVRFAISPLMELHRSVRALDDPAAQAIHLPWIASTRELVDDLPMDLLHAFQPGNWYAPDFIHPPPTTPLAEFEDELAEMLATPDEQVVSEIRFAAKEGQLPPLLSPFLDDPRAAVAELAELVRAYWERAIAPHWERLRSVLEGDVLYRARQMADGGAEALFADLHPEARYEDDALWIEKPFEETVTLDGRGLLFVPSAFAWPRLFALTEPPWQPTLMYPARGVATLWEPGRATAPEALVQLLGARRAAVLSALSAPRSTTELARSLGLSAPSVSQHLAVLRDAGLVNGHRVGRVVLYMRSPTGESLSGQAPLSASGS